MGNVMCEISDMRKNLTFLKKIDKINNDRVAKSVNPDKDLRFFSFYQVVAAFLSKVSI